MKGTLNNLLDDNKRQIESNVVDDLKDQIKNNKLHFSDYDVICPFLQIINDDVFLRINVAPFFNAYWIDTQSKKEYRLPISKLWYTVQQEIGDFQVKCKQENHNHYLLAAPCLLKGYIPSNKYKGIAICSVTKEKELFLCWVHPYFRRRGIMSTFISELMNQTGCFSVITPISKEMEKCMEKSSKIILSNPEYCAKMISHKKHLLTDLGISDIDKYSKDEIRVMHQVFQNWLSSGMEKYVPKDKLPELLKVAVDMNEFFTKNPELREQFMSENGEMDNFLNEKVELFKRTGRSY